MKSLLRFLVALLALLLLCCGAWCVYMLWLDHAGLVARHARLDAANLELRAENTRQRSEIDLLRAESHRLEEAKESLARRLVDATAECDKLRADVRRQVAEKERAERALRAELAQTKARVKTAETRVRSAEARAKKAELVQPQSPRDREVEDVFDAPSLQELMELTDKAPRQPPEK